MLTDIIIQARMGSTRLSGKILKKIQGQTILERVYLQCKKVTEAHEVIIATTTNPNDNIIEEYCRNRKILFYRGDEENVLRRFVKTSHHFLSDQVVRICADNPYLEPFIVSKLIKKHNNKKSDYTYLYGFPLGIFCEAFSTNGLQLAEKLAKFPHNFEHLGTFFLENRKLFNINSYKAPKELFYPKLRLTVDTQEDYQTAKNISKHLKEGFDLYNIIQLVKERPEILVNLNVPQFYPNKNIEKIFKGHRCR